MDNKTLAMSPIVHQIVSRSRHSVYIFFRYTTINAVTAVRDKTSMQIYAIITVSNMKYIPEVNLSLKFELWVTLSFHDHNKSVHINKLLNLGHIRPNYANRDLQLAGRAGRCSRGYVFLSKF
jgi:hypothetical protein